MSAHPEPATAEREAIRQYADWYSQEGYQVSVEPAPGNLPDFLRALAPDLVARRNGENIVIEVRTSSPAKSDRIRQIARALEHRAGWKLQVVYLDVADPEWQPPAHLPDAADLIARLDSLSGNEKDVDQGRGQFLLLWSIIEAAARHRLTRLRIPPTQQISSSALIKTLLTEGIIEEEQYSLLRRGLAVRNAVAHGFLNQSVEPVLFEELRQVAGALLRAGAAVPAGA
jgi:hypothetical protein